MKRIILALGLFGLALAAAFAAESIPGEVIVNFKPSVSASAVRALNSKMGVKKARPLYTDALAIRPDWTQLQNHYRLSFDATRDVTAVVNEYAKDANVISAAPNTIVRAFATPNDPLFSQQWGLAKILAAKGWDRTTGTSEIIVAVLDTGINYEHEDFAGKVDQVRWKNYIAEPVTGNAVPLDDYGHGTAVSGVIGAVTNNGKGVAGMDWQAKILPIKVLDSNGQGAISGVNSALAYLAALKATGVNVAVANMSLGQYSANNELQLRCSDAYNQGITLVAAAGNGDVDRPTYPAYYPTVIAVAATDSNDVRSFWGGIDPDTFRPQASNYGAWVDVCAPGTDIYTTNKNGAYSGGWKGTSLASPFVAGLAALVKAANPNMTNAQVIDQIELTTDSVDALNPGYAGKLGSGRINAYRALFSIQVFARISLPAAGAVIKGITEIKGAAYGMGFRVFTLEAERVGSGSSEVLSTSNSPVGGGNVNGLLANWDTAGLDADYVLRLRVNAIDDSESVSTETIAVDNTSPEAAITSPLVGATVGGKVGIQGKAADAHFDRYALEYGAGSAPLSFQKIGTYYLPVSGGLLGTWETSGLQGIYTLRLGVYDLAGNYSVTAEAINIAAVSPDKEVVKQQGLPITFALPNPFDRTVTSETFLTYDLAGNFAAVVYIFDLGGNLIWRDSYAPGDNGGKAGANNPAWDGKNLFGENVPNGVYIYQIAADGKIIGRGKIAIVN